ncbi:MAG: PEP-CTERM sorting domain-containing protein [Fimbriimonadaceae bacterium]
MIASKAIRALFVVSTATCCNAAMAYVTSFDAFRTQFYTQTSDSAPVTPDTYQFYTRIFLGNQNDADTGTLTDPNGNNYAMSQVLFSSMSSAYYLAYGDNTATSQAQEDTMYPSGTYTYTLHGGTNGFDGNQASLVVGADDFSTTVPFLTSGTYSALQGMDPSQSISLQWGNFNDSLSMSDRETFLTVLDMTAGGTVAYSNNGLAGQYESDTIGAGTFIAGHQYQYTLFFSSRFNQGSGVGDALNGFYGSNALASFDYATSGTFTPAPEPVTIAGLAVGALALLRRRRA